MLESSSTSLSNHLALLNDKQREAASHHHGPILVLAGAGSGKTRALTHRVVNLISAHAVAPHQILAVTFTNKAANEMRARLAKLLGADSQRVWVTTFHSAGLRILRSFADKIGFSRNFIVYDDQDCKALLKKILKEIGIDEKKFGVAYYQKVIDSAKNRALNPEDYAMQSPKFDPAATVEVYEKYQEALRHANAMDFGDLLLYAVELFQKNPQVLAHFQHGIRFVLVDEYQDTNHVQYLLLRDLVAVHKNILVVGDDDQSIYAFRGANLRNILDFERDFPGTKVVKLEQNYRSTTPILECAYSVISKNRERMEKKLWTDRKEGELVNLTCVEDENSEAEYIANQIEKIAKAGSSLDNFAVFYRTNAQSRAVEEALIRHQIRYKIYGGLKFFERKEVKDTLAYLRLVLNEKDDQAFLRIVNVPTRGIGAQTLQMIVEQASQTRSALYPAAMQLAAEGATKFKGVLEFINLIESLKLDLEKLELSELINSVMEKSGYIKKLKLQDDPTHESRIENIKELMGLARAMKTEVSPEAIQQQSATSLSPKRQLLHEFLDRSTLTAGSDMPDERGRVELYQGTVSLMTLHLAKGLEFSNVFLTGVEEGLLPHSRSIIDAEALDEERRLFYVGLTRAINKLEILYARKRAMFDRGSGYFREPSRFIFDLPNKYTNRKDLSFNYSDPQFDPNKSADFQEVAPDLTLFKRVKSNLSARLVSADNLDRDQGATLNSSQSQQLISTKMLTQDQLKSGLEVRHTVFGVGVIQDLTELDDPEARVTIKFNNFSAPKKLILKYTKLYAIS